MLIDTNNIYIAVLSWIDLISKHKGSIRNKNIDFKDPR